MRRGLGAPPPRRRDAHPAFPNHALNRSVAGRCSRPQPGKLGEAGARALDTPLPAEAELSGFLLELVLQVRKLRF